MLSMTYSSPGVFNLFLITFNLTVHYLNLTLFFILFTYENENNVLL